jgi:hypothetical protein
MVFNKTLAWAFAFALAGGTAAAAQVIDYSRSEETPNRITDQATRRTDLVQLSSKALSGTEVKVLWGPIADDTGVSLELRTANEPWQDIGQVRLGPPCKGCSGGVHVIGVVPGETYFFRMRQAGVTAPVSTETAVTAYYEDAPECGSDGGLCLDGRYHVQARYEGNRSLSGAASSVRLTQESGYFWFFAPGNIELVVKVLDGCSVNDHHWVFLTGLTSLRVVAVVTDTQTGATSTYLSQRDQPFPTIQDVSAFATCG